MHLTIGNLAIGKWRMLSPVELEKLNAAIEESSGLPVKTKRIKPERAPKVKEAPVEKETIKPRPATETKKSIKSKGAGTAAKTKNTTGTKPVGKTEKEPAKKGSYKAFRQKGRQR